MLSRVQIKEFRCLREVDVPLKPLTVLIGANNTGKSAFLSAIELLGTSPENPDGQHAVQSTDLWILDSTCSPSIVGDIDGNKVVRVDRGPLNKKLEDRQYWIRNGDNSDITPISLFNTSTLMPAMLSPGAEEKIGIPLINNTASNLPAYLDALIRKDRDRFLRVLDKLKELVPGLVDLKIEKPSVK
ncbi:MAG: AAA family ATPase, partial [Planctomycetes bacterium]|nr:AAA family ATPase [Planctomycetota bacterium]